MIQEIIDSEIIKQFCKNNNISKLSLFGSVLRDDFDIQKSDIDILVEFEKGKIPSLFQFASLEIELSRLLRKKVDLKTKEDLSIYFRDEVVQNAYMVYEPGVDYEP